MISGRMQRVIKIVAMQQSPAAQGFVKKLSFFSKSLLTLNEAWDYKPLTNEGGGAAGDRRTRSEVSYESLVRICGFQAGTLMGSRG